MELASGHWWDRSVSRPRLATTALLDQLYPVLQRERNPKLLPTTLAQLFDDPNPRNRAIIKKLNDRISMNFPNQTPLEDIKKYVEQSTQDAAIGLPTGIPIYVNLKSLSQAKQGMYSTVSINLEGVALRTTLGLMLDQLGLTYDVRDGLLTITKGSAGVGGIDSFRRVGHCYWGLLAASFGGAVGRWFSKSHGRARVMLGTPEIASGGV